MHEVAAPDKHIANVQLQEHCILWVVAARREDPQARSVLDGHHHRERYIAIFQISNCGPAAGGLWCIGMQRLASEHWQQRLQALLPSYGEDPIADCKHA